MTIEGQEGTIEALRAAQRRLDIAGRAQWLVALARRAVPHETRELMRADPTRDEQLCWEAMAFSKGMRYVVGGEEKPPTWKELTHAHRYLLTILGLLKKGRAEVSEPGRTVMLRLDADGFVHEVPAIPEMPFFHGFLFQAKETLVGLKAQGYRLRLCEECSHLFIAKRIDTVTCSVTCRTKAWRDENPARAKAARRARYERKVKAERGKNVRVGKRKGGPR